MKIRQSWHRVVVLAAVLAVGGTLTMSGSALAYAPICTLNGQQLCIGASSVVDGVAVTGTGTGREMVKEDQGFTSGGYEVYRIAFNNDTSKCVGLSSSTWKADIRDCSGGNSNYTNWQRIPQSGGWVQWQNNSAPQGRALASDNTPGDQLVGCTGTCGGYYYTWQD